MTSSVTTSGPFSLRLEAPAVIAGGQPVPLRLVLTNISKDTVMFALPSVGRLQTDYKVYRWSYRVRHKLWHRSGASAELQGPLAPGDSLIFMDMWPQRTDHRLPVGPGKYTVIGTVHELGNTQSTEGIVSAPLQVRIR
ncbi:MAG: hypothetical protein ACJ8AK_13565 [Gemmatimonadaceae bacterium]